MALWNQPALREDHRLPYGDLIHRVSREGDYIQTQILIWAIIHRVPLLQFGARDLHIAFYEEVYADPSGEVSRILRFMAPGEAADGLRLPSALIQKRAAWPDGTSLRDARRSPRGRTT